MPRGVASLHGGLADEGVAVLQHRDLEQDLASPRASPGIGPFIQRPPKLFAKKTTPNQPALQGPSFDGSYGIDADDLVSIPSIDFGSLYVITFLARSARGIQ